MVFQYPFFICVKNASQYKHNNHFIVIYSHGQNKNISLLHLFLMFAVHLQLNPSTVFKIETVNKL